MIGGIGGLKRLDPKKRNGGNQGKVPEFVAATSWSYSYTAPITIDRPPGLQDGDLLLLFSKQYVGYFKSPSIDWRKIGLTGDSTCGEVTAKVAAGEPASLVFPNATSPSSINAILAAFRGRANFGELLELPDISFVDGSSSPSVATASRLASRAGLLVLFICFRDSVANADILTPPSGMAQRHTLYGAGRSYLFTQLVNKGENLSRAFVCKSNVSGSSALVVTSLLI